MVKPRIKQTMPYDSPRTSFMMPKISAKISAKFQWDHPKLQVG